MPVLYEGDEQVSLGDILLEQNESLSEPQSWAVLREGCRALEQIHNGSDIFQSLCITPDSLAFDSTGSVFFLNQPTGEFSRYHLLCCNSLCWLVNRC